MAKNIKDKYEEEFEEDCEVDDDETVYVLTEAACMQVTLEDFGINVSIPMAKAIEERFIELMCKAGYIGENTTEC